jgi:hypothetical protein
MKIVQAQSFQKKRNSREIVSSNLQVLSDQDFSYKDLNQN